MAIALDPQARYEYVLIEDRKLPDEQKTVWEYRALTAKEQASIEDGLVGIGADGEGMTMNNGTQTWKLLKMGLVGCRNLRKADGSEVPFEQEKGHPRQVTEDFLNHIQGKHRTEIGQAILSRGEVTQDQGN